MRGKGQEDKGGRGRGRQEQTIGNKKRATCTDSMGTKDTQRQPLQPPGRRRAIVVRPAKDTPFVILPLVLRILSFGVQLP